MNDTSKSIIRCAIYTRKSHEEGLDQDFNSLDAQRTAAENFVASQTHEGWIILPKRYDDGGYSGGTLERPALQQLLEDMKAGFIDCVIVYKIDRLSRSLYDFIKLLDVFEKTKISFVSITQSFNTSTSMGRLMLNILLSFAQYERELTGERIRDKFALSRQKGIWMGGTPPLGYDVDDRKLVVNEAESKLVQFIFTKFIEIQSTTKLVRLLNAQGHTTKDWISRSNRHYPGKPFSKNALRHILLNPVYQGKAVHKGHVYLGQHEAIIDEALWKTAQALFKTPSHTRGRETSAQTSSLLKGILHCGHCACAMVPTYTIKGHKRYHYYVCAAKRKGIETACVPIAAGEVERFVIGQVRKVLRCPEMIAGVCHAVTQSHRLSESTVITHFQNIEAVWEELFPTEQHRVLQMLVESVIMTEKGLEVRIKAEGLQSLIDEVKGDEGKEEQGLHQLLPSISACQLTQEAQVEAA